MGCDACGDHITTTGFDRTLAEACSDIKGRTLAEAFSKIKGTSTSGRTHGARWSSVCHTPWNSQEFSDVADAVSSEHGIRLHSVHAHTHARVSQRAHTHTPRIRRAAKDARRHQHCVRPLTTASDCPPASWGVKSKLPLQSNARRRRTPQSTARGAVELGKVGGIGRELPPRIAAQ